MKGLLKSFGDIVSPSDESWNALSEAEDEFHTRAPAKRRARRK